MDNTIPFQRTSHHISFVCGDFYLLCAVVNVTGTADLISSKLKIRMTSKAFKAASYGNNRKSPYNKWKILYRDKVRTLKMLAQKNLVLIKNVLFSMSFVLCVIFIASTVFRIRPLLEYFIIYFLNIHCDDLPLFVSSRTKIFITGVICYHDLA